MIVESMREATRKELIERIKELEQENREIREWKYVIDNPIDLEKLKELDLIKIKGKEYISKDEIKAEIEDRIKSVNETYEKELPLIDLGEGHKIINKRNCLLVQKATYQEILSLLEKE